MRLLTTVLDGTLADYEIQLLLLYLKTNVFWLIHFPLKLSTILFHFTKSLSSSITYSPPPLIKENVNSSMEKWEAD